MNEFLITVSGSLPDTLNEDVAKGRRPEPDYLAMARAFPADLLDYQEARKVCGGFGETLEKLGGPNLVLAWACFLLRHRYRVIFTDGEQVGLPFALFLKLLGGTGDRAAHVMIVHVLSVAKKTVLLDRFGLSQFIDKFVVYSTWQQRFIRERWHLSDERVVFTPFMVNSEFFAPGTVSESDWPEWLRALRPPILCSVGLERRDYPTLIEAVRGLDVRVVIAAASPWSKQSDTTRGREIPENVVVRKFTQFELRLVYDASSFLVMPLQEVDFQAGVTAILEAMAMGKPVVCTRTPGQTDVVEAGKTGLYVPAHDAQALRQAIQRLLSSPHQLQAMGEAGRQVIETSMSLEHYANRLAELVRETGGFRAARLGP